MVPRIDDPELLPESPDELQRDLRVDGSPGRTDAVVLPDRGGDSRRRGGQCRAGQKDRAAQGRSVRAGADRPALTTHPAAIFFWGYPPGISLNRKGFPVPPLNY